MTPEASTEFFSLDACRGPLVCARYEAKLKADARFRKGPEPARYLRRFSDETIFR